MCHVMKRIISVLAAGALLLGPATAGAQEIEPADDEAVEETPTRTEAPDTDTCPWRLQPQEPVTTSERLAPGQQAPAPLPPVESDESCGITAPEGFEVDEDVLAAAWMISDLDTGEIIAMKDPNGRYRPASTIKALLAMVVLREVPLDKKVTVSEESAAIDGSAVGIGAGGEYTIEELLAGLLMASGNDAAHALAQEVGGDEAALSKVNALAQELGATSTYAASYSGLDAPGMQTSARDMSVIYRAAFAEPEFARLVATDHRDFPGYGDVPGYELWNDNGLFLNDPDGIGGKTGYTDDAHHTFVGALDRDGRRLQAIILNTTVDHGPRAWQQAQMLLHEAYQVPAGQGVGTLIPEPEETEAPETTEPAPASTTPPTVMVQNLTQSRWLGWGAIGLVGVLIAIAVAFLLPGRSRRGRASRGRHARR